MPEGRIMETRRKVIGVPLRKDLSKASDGTLLVHGYFTSDNRDEVGDIITRSATERAIPKYRQWGNIRYMHLPRPVAKVVRIGVEDGLEWNEVEIKVIDPQAVFEVENGLLAALSVGILVNFDDIDYLDDGGWVINDYTLAEISLVDHPANYDAALKGVSQTQELRDLVRESGLALVARSLDTLSREAVMPEEPKQEEKEAGLEEAFEQLLPVEPAPVEEEVAVEEVPEVEVVEPEAAVEPEAEIAEEEAAVEPEAGPVTDPEAASVIEEFASLKSLIESLRGEVVSLRNALETRTEVQVVTPVQDAGGEVAEIAEPVEEIEAGLPASRPGAVTETELVEETRPVEETPQTKDLRSTLKSYLINRK